MKTFLLVVCLAVLPGCARFKSTVTETEYPDGSKERVTIVRASTFFESRSELSRLSSGQTDKSQKISIGALNQESTATNAVNLMESVIGPAVRAAVKP